MKKVYLLGFILAATAAHWSPASAAESVAVTPAPAGCPKAFQGFHLGGNIGAGFINGKKKFKHAIDDGTGAFVVDRSISNRIGGSGVDGGIGVGYTHRLCNWALGIAFDANWSNASGKLTETDAAGDPTKTVSLNARLRNSLQLYARLGYVMREIAMPFVALGWDNSQWKQNGSINFAQDDAGNPAFSEKTGKSKRFNAFLWKAGVDFLATKHVVVGLEYTGTVAGSKSFKKTFNNPQTGDTEQINASFKPQYNKFALTVKLVY